MDSNVIGDYKLLSNESHAFNRKASVSKSSVGISEDELNLRISVGQVTDINLCADDFRGSLVDMSLASFGTINCVCFACLETFGAIFCSYKAWNAKFAADNGSMTCSTAAIGND
jgi:hypothetical protein